MSGYQTQKQRDELQNRHKLVVRVIEARGLKAADFGGTSDPFCELQIKNDHFSYKTRVVKVIFNFFILSYFLFYKENFESFLG